MGETLNDSYHDSNDKLRGDANKISENPNDTDIRRRFMKMVGDIDYIVWEWRVSDLWLDKLSEVKQVASVIEESLAKVIDILSLPDKDRITLDSKEQLSLLNEDVKWQIQSLLS